MKRILFYLATAFILLSCSENTDPTASHNLLLAYSYATDFVEKRLKDPDSAEFASVFDRPSHTTHIGGWNYEVKSYVKSKNSFGAYVTNTFTCKVSFDKENETVSVTDIKIY